MAEATKIQLLLEAESRGILPPDKAELLAEARSRGLVREASTPAPEMTEQQFTQERQGSALQDAARGSRQLARGTVAGLGAAAGFIPGVGVPTQMAIGAGTETVSQLFGDEPMNPTQIGVAAAIPAAAYPLGALLKGGSRALGKLMSPAKAKEGGIEAIVEGAGGVPASSAARVTTTPASKAAYEVVAQQGPVPTAGLASETIKTLTKVSRQSNPPKGPGSAMEHLENLFKKFDSNKSLDYEDIADELSQLGQKADEVMDTNHVAGVAMHESRHTMLKALEKLSPAIEKATGLYRKEQTAKEIVKALRGGNSGTAIRKLFESNKVVAGGFNEKEIDEIYNIADEISNMATNSIGITNRIFNTVIATPFAQGIATKTGRSLIRRTMKPTGHLTAAGIATVAQFMRAYTAQGGTD